MAKFGYMFRSATVLLLAAASWSARADEYVSGWGPAVGAPMPMLQALDQSGTPRTLENLAGEHGLLLFLNRSADW